MKKRVFAYLLAFCLMCAAVPAAFAADGRAALPRPGQAEVFSGWWMVVDQSGRLHAYNLEDNQKESIPMTGVSMVTKTLSQYVLALKTDGTLWVMADEYYDLDSSGYERGIRLTKPVQLLSGVRKIEGDFALCKNGDLYGIAEVGMFGGTPGKENFSVTKIAANVTDVAEDGSFISGNKLMRGWTTGAEEKMTLPFSDGVEIYGSAVHLIRTAGGDVWAWGDSDFGGVGNGMLYDEMWQFGFGARENGWYTTTLRTFEPVKILSGAASLWAEDDAGYYAIKKDGSVWKWGDAYPVMTYWDADSDYLGESRFPADETGYTPHKVIAPDHWDFADGFNIVRFQADGTCRAMTWKYNDAYQAVYTNHTTLANWADDPGNTTPFTDVKSSQYYYEPVKWAVEKGITSGTSATTFSPNQTCTRGQIITFLWRAAGSPEPENAAPFSDVDASAYYAKAIAWAAEHDMAARETFAPNAPCTRLMAVEFMWKYAGSPNASKASFTDVNADAVNWAVQAGVTAGTTLTTFSPDQTCTRAQIVTFLYRGFAE